MTKTYNIAVVGATGAVGETMLSILEERNFPVGEVYALASANSVGKRVPFKGGTLKVEDLATFDFSKVQIPFACKLLFQELQAINVVPRIITEGV